MGHPTPFEPTPPYEEATSGSQNSHPHHVRLRPHSPSPTHHPATEYIYADLPQADLETGPIRQHSCTPLTAHPTTSIVTTAHEHCEVCERAVTRRERKHAQMHCCRMVALVFIVLFICLTILGIVLARAGAGHH
ncbi:uncharacterized protein BO80DRAFT_462692 [Aspergillus ibericus CBS 121593]|uniref:Uncharacterized protein n=1 Tax=Aspergillus ibericus CBS 121593 TaxID=1448316 RepID=A0A395HBA1_9EURO|nr:hypothetical protein BO80DRAFT_462692 [Aspergillus ibericus CBS 121593]RAL03484.1 hypothetical protein BO80DRAFT_462692 [Aspergillus ibericus CBS 121593]